MNLNVKKQMRTTFCRKGEWKMAYVIQNTKTKKYLKHKEKYEPLSYVRVLRC